MYYKSNFSNKNNVEYYITIEVEGSGETVNFTMTPSFILETSSDSLFSPIKSRALTFEMLTEYYKMGLYQPSARGAKVVVRKDSEESDIIFRGNITPNVYDQDWTYLDTVTIECVDAISTAKNYKHVNTLSYDSFFDIIMNIIKDCEYEGYVHVPQTYENVNGKPIDDDILKILHISSTNFIDDDDLRTPQNNYDVLIEILKYLGWTLTINGDDIILVDYRAISTGNTITYKKYLISDSSLAETYTYTDSTALQLSDYAGGTSTVSMDDIYNKIEVSDNLYEIDEISPDIFEEEFHISINQEQNFDYNTVQWEKTNRSGWWLWKKEEQEITGYDYQTICRITPASGWKHLFYKCDDILNVDVQPLDYSNPNSPDYNPEKAGKEYYYEYPTSANKKFTTKPINKYCNTHGCLIQHYAYRKEVGNNLPSKLDWDDYLTFFICNDKTPNIDYQHLSTDTPKLEKPVLIYETDEEVFYKPATGTSWITIKGDLFYQNNKGTFGDKGKDIFEVINYDKDYYITSPCDKAIDIQGKQYFGLSRSKEAWPTVYYSGFPCWKMCVQVGDKYWTEHWDTNTRKFVGQWVAKEHENDPDPTFYIHYNNGPTDGADEYLPAFEWVSPINNNDFKDQVGVDGYAIPIAANDDDAPSKGKLKITVYTPAVMPYSMIPILQLSYEVNDLMSQNWLLNWVFNFDSQFNTESIPWVILVKDFEIGYVYTDTQEWYKSHKDENKTDKVYTGYINDDYVKSFSKLELKVNTSSKDRPISRSYVTTSNNYVDTMKHITSDEKVQELNIVDMYLDHYSDKKIIYKCHIRGLRDPRNLFTANNITGTMVIDKQEYDLYSDINTTTLIVY